MNNAVEHAVRAGGWRPTAPQPPLPKNVEWLLNSPTLEQGGDMRKLLGVMERFWGESRAACGGPRLLPAACC